MIAVSAKELKNKTGNVLRLVAEGQVVLITKNRKPLAKVTLVSEQELERLDLRPFDTAWQDIERALGGSKPRFKSMTEAMRWSRRRRS